MRSLGALLVAAVTLALPLSVFAQSTSSSNNASLIAEITALEQQIEAIVGTTTTASTPTQSTTPTQQVSGFCPDLSRSLSYGSIGIDVSSLQTFLAQEGLFSASATGYFGTLTQNAVAQWQEKNNVVSGGDANSTGLGVVGPRTRAAIEASCGSSDQSQTSVAPQCLDVQPPSTECASGWQPVADASGCTTYYQCVITLPTATSSATSPAATTSCPVVQQPVCSGTVTPFQTNANGCVIGYQCVL